MADEKKPSERTEVISTAASSRGKVRWSSATGKLETQTPAQVTAEADPADPSVPWGKKEVSSNGEAVSSVAETEDGDADADAGSTEVVAEPAAAEPLTAEAITPADTTTGPKVETPDAPVSKRRPSLRARLRSAKSKATEIPILIFMAFAIAIVIKTFLVQAFYIPSTSMLPTLRTGDRVLVEKLSYRFTDPGRGDVVVFEKSVFGANKNQDLPWYQDAQGFFRELLGLPTGTEEDYIKRIVAVSGDVVEYKGSPRKLFVNKEKVPQDFIYRGRDTGSPTLTSADCKRLKMQRAGSGCRVPAGRVFVMGDNRGNSEDSRILGPISEDKIVGRAFVIIWPPSDFGGL